MATEIQGPKYKVPPGLKCLLEEMSREVLRNQPTNIYEFLANYLEEKLRRQGCGGEDVGKNPSGNKTPKGDGTDGDGSGESARAGRGLGQPGTGGGSGEFPNVEDGNTGTTRPTVDPSKVSNGYGPDGQPQQLEANAKAPFGYDASGRPIQGPNKDAPFGYGPDGKPLTQVDPDAPYGYGPDGKPLNGIACVAPYGLDQNGEALLEPDPNAPFGYHPSDGLPVATNDPTAPFGFGKDDNPLIRRDPDAVLGYSVTGEPNLTPETVAFCGDTAQNGSTVGNNSQPIVLAAGSSTGPGPFIPGQLGPVNDSSGDKALQFNSSMPMDPGANSQGAFQNPGGIYQPGGSRSVPGTNAGLGSGNTAPSGAQGRNVVSVSQGQLGQAEQEQLQPVNQNQYQGGAMVPGQGQGQTLPSQSQGQMVPNQSQGQMVPDQGQGQMAPNQGQGQMSPIQSQGQGQGQFKGSSDSGIMYIGTGGTQMLLSYDPGRVNAVQPPINHMANAATSGAGNQVGVIDCADVIRSAVENMLGRVVSLMSGIITNPSSNQMCGTAKPNNGLIQMIDEPRGQTPNQTQGQNPNQGQYPNQSQEQYPNQGQGQYPNQGQGQYPNQNQEQYPKQGQGQNPNQSQGQYPNQSQGQNPNQGQQGRAIAPGDLGSDQLGPEGSKGFLAAGAQQPTDDGQYQGHVPSSNDPYFDPQLADTIIIDQADLSAMDDDNPHVGAGNWGDIDPKTGNGAANQQLGTNPSQGQGLTKSNQNLIMRQYPAPQQPSNTYVNADGQRQRCIPLTLKQFVPGNQCVPINTPFDKEAMLAQLAGPNGILPPGFTPSQMHVTVNTLEMTAYDPENPNNVAFLQHKTQSTVAFGTMGGQAHKQPCGKRPPPIPPRLRPGDSRLKVLQVKKAEGKNTSLGEYIESIVGRAGELMSIYKQTCVKGLPSNYPTTAQSEDCVEEPETPGKQAFFFYSDGKPIQGPNPEAPFGFDRDGKPLSEQDPDAPFGYGPDGQPLVPQDKQGKQLQGSALNSALCEQNPLTAKSVGRHLQDLAPQLKEYMQPLSSDDEHTLMLLTTVGSLLDTIEDTGLAQMDPKKLCGDTTLKNLADTSERMLVSLKNHLEKITGDPYPDGADPYMGQITREAHEALKIGAESLEVAVTLLQDVIPLCEELNNDPEQLEKCAATISTARRTMEESMNAIGQAACQDGPQNMMEQVRGPGEDGTGTSYGAESSSSETGNDGVNVAGSSSNPRVGDQAEGTEPDPLKDDAGNQTTDPYNDDETTIPVPDPDLNQGQLSKTHIVGEPSMDEFSSSAETSTMDDQRAPFGFDADGKPIQGPSPEAPYGYGPEGEILTEQDPNAPYGYGQDGQPLEPLEPSKGGEDPMLWGALEKGARPGPDGETTTLFSSGSRAMETDSSAAIAPKGPNWSGSVSNFMRSQMVSVQNLLSGQTPLSEARGQIIFLTVSFVVGVVVGYAIARSVGLIGVTNRSATSSSLFGVRQRAIEGSCGICGASPKTCPVTGHVKPTCGCRK